MKREEKNRGEEVSKGTKGTYRKGQLVKGKKRIEGKESVRAQRLLIKKGR